ncbi:GNAT family protein [Saccharopolyspora sp. NPDC002686]|uniref:GNAT family N-acetyltransferase n=1 Tax=Saccharopolyspora sp. NPDC002686 TaxID=3154541 RepID=UPI003320B3D1
MTMIPPRPSAVHRASRPTSGWVGRRVRLRGIEPGDRRTLVGFDRESASEGPPQFDGYRHWAAHRANHLEAGEDLQLAIETRQDRTLVGSLSTSQPEAGIFSYGIGIGPQHRRHGYADDAINTLLGYMFGHRRFTKCEVGIYSSNAASLTLHARLGFREEGHLRDPEFLCGGAQYLVLMGITAEEFATRRLPRAR